LRNLETEGRSARFDGDVGDLLTPAAVRDPYANFDELRAHDPVHWSQVHRAWLVTRHADVSAGFRDPRLSSDRISGFTDRLSPEDQVMMEPAFGLLRHWHVFMDPPDHTRLRRLVQRAFTPKMIALKEPRIREIISGLIGGTTGLDSFDFIQEVAYPLPAIVIAEMLGVPPEDRELFKGFSDEISALVFGATTEDDRHERAINGMIAMTDYLNDLIAHFSAHPGENLITDLVNAHESGDHLSSIEVVATCALLLFGGHETTTNLLASGTLALLQDPAALNQFIEQPEIIGAVVEELLRFDGPAKLAVRVAAEQIELHGATIKPLDRVFLVNSSANRDSAKFDHPDRLDFNRADNPHIAFGLGLHYCLGASLARLEGRIVFDMLRPLLQSWQLDNSHELEWHPTLLSRGLIGLPLIRSA
jgi:cytochrome P450